MAVTWNMIHWKSLYCRCFILCYFFKIQARVYSHVIFQLVLIGSVLTSVSSVHLHSDWPNRSGESQRHDGKWRYCACSMCPLMQKSKTLQSALGERLHCHESAACWTLGAGRYFCRWRPSPYWVYRLKKKKWVNDQGLQVCANSIWLLVFWFCFYV